MAEYEVFTKPSDVKELEGIGTKKDRQRIVAQIQELTENLAHRVAMNFQDQTSIGFDA